VILSSVRGKRIVMDNVSSDRKAHYMQSTLREKIVEHVFVGDALRRLWQRGITDVEILRSEFDAGGYDLVMSHGKVVRHIQFKISKVDGKRRSITASVKLMDKPSGCILWLFVDPDLNIKSYRWYGNAPGKPLDDISGFPTAKHTKGNSNGDKNERPDQRVITLTRFSKDDLKTIDQVLDRLFEGLPNGANP
jgi:hypothetical protein